MQRILRTRQGDDEIVAVVLFDGTTVTLYTQTPGTMDLADQMLEGLPLTYVRSQLFQFGIFMDPEL